METKERKEGILDPRELIHVTPAIDQNLRRGDGSIHDRLPPSLPSIKRIERQPGKQERKGRSLAETGRPTDRVSHPRSPPRYEGHAQQSSHPPIRRLGRGDTVARSGLPVARLYNELPLQLDPSAQFLTKV